MQRPHRASLEAIRIRNESNAHSRTLEERLQAPLNQFYRLTAVFALIIFAGRVGYQALSLTSLSHLILLLGALIALAVVGDQINKASAQNKKLRDFERSTFGSVTYTVKRKGSRS